MKTALLVCIVIPILALELTVLIKAIQKWRSPYVALGIIVVMFLINAAIFTFVPSLL